MKTLLTILLFAVSATAQIYVSTTGTEAGPGTIGSPYDLKTALQLGSISGQTVYVRGGEYKGKFISNTSNGTIRPYGNETVKIDGNYLTTLAVAIDSTATQIVVAPGLKYSVGQGLQIGTERMSVTSVVNATTYDVSRPAAMSHSAGETVEMLGAVFAAHGSGVTFRDLEVLDSNATRAFYGSSGGGLRTVTQGFFIFGDNVSLINNVIHDTGDGVFSGEGAENTLIYGNVIYNNGYVATDRGHGHGLYTQNDTGTKNLKENVIFNNFGYGIHAYGSQAHANNLVFEGNVSFNNGAPSYFSSNPTPFPNETTRRNGNLLLRTDNNAANDIVTKNNYLFHRSDSTNIEFGGLVMSTSGGNDGLTMQDNYVSEPGPSFNFWSWTNFAVTGNTFHVNVSGANVRMVNAEYQTSATGTFNNNTYYAPTFIHNCFGGSRRAPFFVNQIIDGPCNQERDFQMWKDIWADRGLTFDANSSYSELHPSTNVTFVRPNAYQAGRATITVYNHQDLGTVSVSLNNTGLTTGQYFRVRNAQNYHSTPALNATIYTGTGMSVNLSTNLTAAAPIGLGYTPPTSSKFVVYVVEPLPVVSLSGTVTAVGGGDTPCVDLSLVGNGLTFYATASAQGGQYSFTNIPVGKYTLTPLFDSDECSPNPLPAFTPVDMIITLTENMAGVNFEVAY